MLCIYFATRLQDSSRNTLSRFIGIVQLHKPALAQAPEPDLLPPGELPCAGLHPLKGLRQIGFAAEVANHLAVAHRLTRRAA